MRTLAFRAMNTEVLIALEGEGNLGAALDEAREFIENCERRFSRFLPDSELSQLNAQHGEWAKVSDDLLEMLRLSKQYHEETGGLFDPAVLPQLKQAGYDRSFEDVRAAASVPENREVSASRPAFSELHIDAATGRVRLPESMEIDLGGIAKGWIVQQATLRLKERGSAAAVSAGGDIYFAGLPMNESSWRVEIEDPEQPSRVVAALRVGGGAVVTSSISKRSWQRDGQQAHHIIDPRTGKPAQADWLSVTVLAPSADLGEVYAKAILIGGRQAAPRFLAQRPELVVICVGPDGQIEASSNSKEYMNDGHQLLQ